MTLPRLHLVTDDAIVADPSFHDRAAALLDAGGPALALHLRAHTQSARSFHELAERLATAALRAGALLLINERVDVALAVRSGAHLNARSVPVNEARRLLHNAPLGYSAHSLEEAALAEAEGADYLFLGHVYATPSHPDRQPAGVELLRRVIPRVRVPVIGIGGITPGNVADVRAAGAHGVAVIRGIWGASDPLDALRLYFAALRAES